MKAMLLKSISNLDENKTPLQSVTIADPALMERQVVIKVSACGVCHTELDEIEGRTPPPEFPIILGHQVIGRVVEKGENSCRFELGSRVGVGWIYSSCGTCTFCKSGNENLCGQFKATGRDANGGYAEYMAAYEDFAFALPDLFTDIHAAPLLCAGAIGYRSLRLSGLQNGKILGLTGFGASAHLVLKMVKHKYPDANVFIFARSEREREFALEIGAAWAGDSKDCPPEKLDCIIDTTPAYKPVIEALKNLKSGGRLIINAIRKENADMDYLLNLDYPTHLWMEKEIKSVANVTRQDISEFLTIASQIPLIPEVEVFDLEDANRALMELKEKKIRGAKVLVIG
jgi:propanol-preferring alcohol dehydrogenase